MKKMTSNFKPGLEPDEIIGQIIFDETHRPHAKITDYNPETGEMELEVDDDVFDALVKKASQTIGISSRGTCNCNNCKCDHNHTDDSGCNCKH